MTALLVFAVAQTWVGVQGTVVDAALGTPVAAAAVEGRGTSTRTDERGRFELRAALGDTLRVRRIGYRPATVAVVGLDLLVALTPTAVPLAEVVVSDVRSVGRIAARREVAALREQAIVSTSDALARMPFVSARSARGALAISMRGSRPEQVLVVLDGVPLNDPATGSADVADIPLAVLSSMAALPGAASAAGSGAAGGVLRLDGSAEPSATTWVGSYGKAGIGGAYGFSPGPARALIGGELAVARGDYAFVNTEGARDTTERRVNNDERRAAAFMRFLLPSVHLTALGTRTERGLVGPMNVRVLDDARGVVERTMVRGVASSTRGRRRAR